MTKKRLWILIGVSCLLVVFLALWLGNSKEAEQVSGILPPEKNREPSDTKVSVASVIPLPRSAYSFMAVAQIAQQDSARALYEAFNAPIDFWGKVVDEKGNPIAGAEIRYGIQNHPERKGKPLIRQSDANGLFSLTGKRGAGLSVKVSKEGYHTTPKSVCSLSYYRRGNKGVEFPSKDNPTVLVLREKKEAAALIQVPFNRVKTTNNGIPVGIDLKTGEKVSPEEGDIVVQCWVENEDQDKRSWDWKAKISVPGGGLAERTDRFEFEAPEEGYKDCLIVEKKADDERWTGFYMNDYFLKLRNGNYARITMDVSANSKPFFTIKTYLNPTPGDRNLEYDPKKRIRID